MTLQSHTSSMKVSALYLWETSHNSSKGQTSPVIECTVSKATILGVSGSASRRSSSRWRGSLCLNMCFFALLVRIPKEQNSLIYCR